MNNFFTTLYVQTKNIFRHSIDVIPSHSVLLYGLQRSGTNYLQTLLQMNYRQLQFINSEKRNDAAHKHFRLYKDKNCIPEPQFMNSVFVNTLSEFEVHLAKIPDLYLVVSKDPYSWYLSYLNWAKKNNWNKPAYHYIEEWNLFYGKWIEFSKQTDKIIFVKYADLLTNPIQEIFKIAEKLNLPFVEKITTPGKVYASKRFTASDAKNYLEKVYVKKYDNNTLSELNTSLDEEVMHKLGYAYETLNNLD